MHDVGYRDADYANFEDEGLAGILENHNSRITGLEEKLDLMLVKMESISKDQRPSLQKSNTLHGQQQSSMEVSGTIGVLNRKLDEHQQLIEELQRTVHNDLEYQNEAIATLGKQLTSIQSRLDKAKFTYGYGKDNASLSDIRSDPNAPDKPQYLNEDIFESCKLGEYKSIQWLLYREPGIVNKENEIYETPLHVAATHDTPVQREICELLLQKGANVNKKSHVTGKTPLLIAAAKGYYEICSILVDYGANVDEKDKFGQTPLFWAVINNHKDLVELLVDKGATIDIRNIRGENALTVGTPNEIRSYLQARIEEGSFE